MQTIGGSTGASTSDRKGFTLRPPGLSTRLSEHSEGGGPLSLHQVKRERRLKEDNVYKLHNRIRMLELEEAKVRRKIEETRRKAQSILEIRMTKEETKSPPRAATPDFRASVYLERKQDHQRIMHQRLSSLIQQKREDATLIKKERRSIMRRKIKFERAAVRQNQEKRFSVICQEREGLERVERVRREKIAQSIMSKEQEYLEQQRALKLNQKAARRLEQAEALALQRLKETHREQKDAILNIELLMKTSGVLSQETLYTTGSRAASPRRQM